MSGVPSTQKRERSGIQGTIEMSRLDVNEQRDISASMSMTDEAGSDDGASSDDDGDVALLNPERQSRGRELEKEGSGSTWSQVKDIVIETAPTLLFTTVGLLFTGELLDHVSHWKAMRRIDELIIMIPVILNLKGNLEMNLSSRLGTAANVGELDDKTSRYGILVGNIALLQVQAALVSFVSAILSFVLGVVLPRSGFSSAEANEDLRFRLMSRRPHPPVVYDPTRPKSGLIEFTMVASTGMTSACLSSLLLGSFMCTLVIFCRKYSLNPDNIAPPIASCLGDLITLCLLGLISTLLIDFVNTPLPLVLCIFLVVSTCFCVHFVLRNSFVRDLLKQGWTPLFGAMMVSTATGIILDLFVSRYKGFALLAVIIAGLPGSVGSVFISRISTTLHAASMTLHDIPTHTHVHKHHPDQPHPSVRLVMITLFLITIPVEIGFLSTLRAVGWLKLPFIFVAFSVLFFCVAVLTSLWMAKTLTNFLWRLERDPDMYAMPIHSSVIDLVGQMLLVLCFEIVSLLGGKVNAKSHR